MNTLWNVVEPDKINQIPVRHNTLGCYSTDIAVFDVCVFHDHSGTAEPCCALRVFNIPKSRSIVVSKPLISVFPHLTVTHISKTKHHILEYFRQGITLFGCLRAFLYSLYRIFIPCAIRCRSLTSSFCCRIPSSQIGFECFK
jgi:hypothetical protein